MNTTGIKQLNALASIIKKNGYKLNQRENEVNIVGVRADSTTPNKFDDRIYAFWKDSNDNWVGYDWAATTDPGTYWLKYPMSGLGTAILKAGQYEYKIGYHKGYKALVQRGKVTTIRDYDRNAILDFNNGKETSGFYGINIHRALASGIDDNVNRWSAGCQVTQDPADFAKFMDWMQKHYDRYGNNTIYYTLIDERALNRELKRKAVYVLTGAASIAYYLINK